MTAPLPDNEAERLEALRQYRVLDTASEQPFDDAARLAAQVCGTPIALVSLIDADRQWFKARFGLDASETPREVAFCAHTILSARPLVVEDATRDRRFADNPFVTGGPQVRFYAGAPLLDAAGHGLGTVCVVDRQPRRPSPEQVAALTAIARQVVALLECRRTADRLAAALEKVKALSGLLPVCAWCRDVRNDAGYWQRVDVYLKENAGVDTTHGICPGCAGKLGLPGA